MVASDARLPLYNVGKPDPMGDPVELHFFTSWSPKMFLVIPRRGFSPCRCPLFIWIPTQIDVCAHRCLARVYSGSAFCYSDRRKALLLLGLVTTFCAYFWTCLARR